MATASGPRGEYAKTAERRSEILEAGMQEFSTSGFRGGSIRGVAERVGMSQAGLLHHFSSKTELLEAILTRRDDDSVRFVGPSDGGLDLLRGLVALTEHNAGTPGLVALYAVLSAEATSPDHPAHEYFRNRYRYVTTLITGAFREAQEQGEVRPEVDPASAARSVTALLDGLQIQFLLDPASVDMGAELRCYLQGLLTVELGAALDRSAA